MNKWQMAGLLGAVGVAAAAFPACTVESPSTKSAPEDGAVAPAPSTTTTPPALDAALPEAASPPRDGALDAHVTDASIVPGDASDGAATCGASAARLCSMGEPCGATADCAAPNLCTSGVCEPLPCAPGSFGLPGACAPCKRGTYTDVAGSAACTACADDFSTAAVGSTSAACVACPAGQIANASTNQLCWSFDGRITSFSVSTGTVVHAAYGGWSGTATSGGGQYRVTGQKGGDSITISWSTSATLVAGRDVTGLVTVTADTGAYSWSSQGLSPFPTVTIDSWNPVTRAVRLHASGPLRRTNGFNPPNPTLGPTSFAGILP